MMRALFVPVLAVSAVYFACYRTKYFKKNVKRKNTKLYFNLHVGLAVLSAVLVLMHAASKIPFFVRLPLGFQVTGIAMLVLAAAQFATGIAMKKKPNQKLFRYHRIIPGALLALVLVHAVVLKMVYFG